MKFRYKVMIVNLILLSMSLGIVGYLMIRKNFTLAKEAAFNTAVTQNNLLQSTAQYELLNVINGEEDYVLSISLMTIGKRISESMLTTDNAFYIVYDNVYVYTSDNYQDEVSKKLVENAAFGKKSYITSKKDGRYFIEVTSYDVVETKPLFIVNKSDITSVYDMLHTQIKYYRVILLTVIVIVSLFIFIFSMLITRPLEKLNRLTDEISEGNYDVRVDVRTYDEIGMLADKFNHMTGVIRDRIEDLNDMVHRRDQFVADFTHEIKTPMTTIIGYADMMRSVDLERSEQIMSLNYIFSEGKRLEDMSHKLFDLLYLRNNTIEKSVVNVTNLAADIRQTMEPALVNKNITLETEIEDSVIYGSRELLITVFVNLIDNAKKASQKGGKILFKGHRMEDGRYEFLVSDNGIGMSEEQIKKVCDEFYMADKSRSRKEGGAGLGMSLVNTIVMAHSATMRIESEIGKGTDIYVVFCSDSKEAADEK